MTTTLLTGCDFESEKDQWKTSWLKSIFEFTNIEKESITSDYNQLHTSNISEMKSNQSKNLFTAIDRTEIIRWKGWNNDANQRKERKHKIIIDRFGSFLSVEFVDASRATGRREKKKMLAALATDAHKSLKSWIIITTWKAKRRINNDWRAAKENSKWLNKRKQLEKLPEERKDKQKRCETMNWKCVWIGCTSPSKWNRKCRWKCTKLEFQNNERDAIDAMSSWGRIETTKSRQCFDFERR